jgi:hypothetical protein
MLYLLRKSTEDLLRRRFGEGAGETGRPTGALTQRHNLLSNKGLQNRPAFRTGTWRVSLLRTLTGIDLALPTGTTSWEGRPHA